jgi:hypothetical protein
MSTGSGRNNLFQDGSMTSSSCPSGSVPTAGLDPQPFIVPNHGEHGQTGATFESCQISDVLVPVVQQEHQPEAEHEAHGGGENASMGRPR